MDESKSETRELPECHEGPAAANAFQGLLKKALATSSTEVKKRDNEWRKKREENKKRQH